MKRPLCIFAAGFCSSCASVFFLKDKYHLLLFCLITVVMILGYIIFVLHNKKTALVLLLAIILGLIYSYGWDYFLYKPYEQLDSQQIKIIGRVNKEPKKAAYGYSYELKILSVEHENDKIKGIGTVTFYCDKILPVRVFDKVSLNGSVQLPPSAPFDGYFDSRSFLKSRGVYLLFNADTDTLNILGRTLENPVLLIGNNIRKYIEDGTKHMGKTEGALVLSLLTGDKSRIDKETKDAFSRSGLSHILAVSGLHMSILVAGLLFLFKVFRIKNIWRFYIVFPIVIIYMAVGNFSPSVVRAGIMALISLLALTIREDYDIYSALSLAALIILIANPFGVGDVSFLLSFSALLGIAVISGKLTYLFSNKDKKTNSKIKRLWNSIVGITALSVGAGIFTMPVLIWSFGTVSIVSPISNLLVIPMMPLTFFAALIYSVIWKIPVISDIFKQITELLVQYIESVAGFMASFQFSSIEVSSSFAFLWGIYCVLLISICLLFYEKGKDKPIIPISAVILTFLISSTFISVGSLDDRAEITYLNVGQGQCSIISANNSTVIVDCGSTSKNINAGDIAVSYLNKKGIKNVNSIVLTHLHTDHADGVVEILRKMDVSKIFLPSFDQDIELYESILAMAEKRGTQVIIINKNMTISVGENANLLLDYEHLSNDRLLSKNMSERNITVMFSYGRFKALYTGDMTGEEELSLAQNTDIRCDILNVSHHGSEFSSSTAFLKNTDAEFAVISAGKNNYYGHPHKETLKRLEQTGIRVLRTDVNGTITIKTNGKEYEIFTQKVE